MNKEKIREIAEHQGMKNTDLFIAFFSERFPNESNEVSSYCSEWVDRFMSGNPMVYMDGDSKKIYRDLISRC